MADEYPCRCCPECSPYGNPCTGCQTSGICDGLGGRCTCNDDPYESPLDEEDDDG